MAATEPASQQHRLEPCIEGLSARPGRSALWRGLRLAWRFLRQISGDDAYERYLWHMARCHPDQTAMSRTQHFAFQQQQKWNRPSRCC
jgi:uncharacterized short protein YbdD (DUF466 family)